MKKYTPNKYICYLYFLVPLIINAIISYSSNEDIWYILKYGEVILQHGFIHTDILTIHSGLHIVIQQGFSNIIFYLIYKAFNTYGFFLLCELYVGLYLFIIYKICMLLSNKKILLSVLIATITCTLLEISFITPSPRIFTYLHLLLIIYIMELFYKDNKSKAIYFLPLISLIQINTHASLWFYLFLFMLPYVVTLIIQKNKNVIKLLIIMLIMFLVGFINPYTYENVFFPFLVYDPIISQYIEELYPAMLLSPENSVVATSIFFYIILAVELLIYIYYKKGKLELRHLFLFGGTTILALAHIRNISVFLIATLPILANYLKDMKWSVNDTYVDTKKTWIIMGIFILVLSILNPNRLESEARKGGEFLLENYDKDIVLYINYDYGSYLEFLGFKCYSDTRAEVFTKKGNRKKDLFTEAYIMQRTCNNYKEFLKYYNFTHLVVHKETCLYQYLIRDKTKIIFKDKEYVIFEL